MAPQNDPLVFGDPEQPLTVGVFVRWLEEHFAPHIARDECQTKAIHEINIAVTGNGDPARGMKTRVDEMWATSQKLDAALNIGRLAWRTAAAVLALAATVAVIGHNVGWW